jgi:hypothetical protein
METVLSYLVFPLLPALSTGVIYIVGYSELFSNPDYPISFPHGKKLAESLATMGIVTTLLLAGAGAVLLPKKSLSLAGRDILYWLALLLRALVGWWGRRLARPPLMVANRDREKGYWRLRFDVMGTPYYLCFAFRSESR